MSLLHPTFRFLAPFTLPTFIVSSPILSTILPIACGTAIGFTISPPSNPDKSKTQYSSLQQPPLHPPPWIFGPVWTVLYAMMGYATYCTYSAGASSVVPGVRQAASDGIALYSFSLLLNYAWTPLFFHFNYPRLALADILALTAYVAATAKCYYKVDSLAGHFFVPYLAWLGFATYLNAGVGYLNGWDVSGMEGTKKLV